MLLPLPLSLLSSGLSSCPFDSWRDAGVIQLAQFILELLFISPLSIVCLNPLPGVRLGLLDGVDFETGGADVLQGILANQVFELLGVALLSLVQKVIHVEDQWEGHPLIQLFALPRPIIQREPRQLKRQNLGQTVQPVTLLRGNFLLAP